MKRISIKTDIDVINFTPKILFYRDDKEFARFDLDMCRSLTAVLGSEAAAEVEILTVLKNELNDPELEADLIEVWNEHKNKK